MAAIENNAVKTGIDGFFHLVERVGVIGVEIHLHAGFACGKDHGSDVAHAEEGALAFGDTDEHRHRSGSGRSQDGVELVGIRNVEMPECNVLFACGFYRLFEGLHAISI